MGGNSFERIMQEIANQKQHLEDLSEENRLLHRQLADLREGRGIFVEIDGQRFVLSSESVVASQISSTALEALASSPGSQSSPATVGMIYSVAPETPLLLDDIPALSASDTPRPQSYIQPNTPLPMVDEQTWVPDPDLPDQHMQEIPNTPTSATFLEDMLVDEFTDAATFQMAAHKRPNTKKLPPIDEEEKAALRKELMGSFLLE
jgi:hypothetical protein